jgi:hypothetical protein
LFAGDEVLEVVLEELLEELLLEGVVPGAGRFFAEAVKPPPPHATVDAIAAMIRKAYKCTNFKKLLLIFRKSGWAVYQPVIETSLGAEGESFREP